MLESISLLPLLLAPGVFQAQVGADRFLSAVPPDTFLAIYSPNPSATLQLRDTNDWVAFMLDSGWDDVVRTLLDAMGDDLTADEIIAWRARVAAAMGEAQEALVFIAGDFTTNEPTTGLMVRGGETCSTLLREFLGEDSVASTIRGGRDVLLSEEGRGELLYEKDGMVLVLSSPTVAGACTVASSILDALEAGGPAAGPFALPGIATERAAARRTGEPALEVAANLGRVWSSIEAIEAPNSSLEERMFASLDAVGWAYVSATFGTGEELGWELVVPFGGETLMGEFLGHFGEADVALLGTVPGSAIEAVVCAFDVAGCVDWWLEVTRETAPELRSQVDDGLQAVKEAVGIDVLGDVVRNLTGQFVLFSTAAGVTVDGELYRPTGAPTFVAQVRDADPLIDIVEQLLDLIGLGTAAELSGSSVAGTDDSLESWRVTEGTPVEFCVAAGAERLALSVDPVGLAAWMALAKSGDLETSMLAKPGLRAATKQLRGALIAVQSTAETASSIEAVVGNFDSLGRQVSPYRPGANADLTALTGAAAQVASLVRIYFEGTTTTQLTVNDGQLRLRFQAR